MMGAEHSIDVTRTCTKCKIAKPATLEFFRAEKRTKIGLQSNCIECAREYSREHRRKDPDCDRRYYEANKHWLLPKMSEKAKQRRRDRPEEARRVAAEYRAKNIARVRQYQREYYARNREGELKRLADYYELNPDKKEAHHKNSEAWRRANREKARSYVRNRRARIKESEGQHTAGDIQKLLDGQKGHCWWCMKKIPAGKHHVDHRIPIARGGGNGPDNLVISCAPCNHRKSSKMPWEMENPRLL